MLKDLNQASNEHPLIIWRTTVSRLAYIIGELTRTSVDITCESSDPNSYNHVFHFDKAEPNSDKLILNAQYLESDHHPCQLHLSYEPGGLPHLTKQCWIRAQVGGAFLLRVREDVDADVEMGGGLVSGNQYMLLQMWLLAFFDPGQRMYSTMAFASQLITSLNSSKPT